MNKCYGESKAKRGSKQSRKGEYWQSRGVESNCSGQGVVAERMRAKELWLLRLWLWLGKESKMKNRI